MSDVSPQRIEALVRSLESSADSATQSVARELVQALLDLHGAGLLRLMELVDQTGGPGARLIDQFGSDPAISRLLLLHGLHPQDFETRVRESIERASGGLRRQGVTVALVRVDESGVVVVRAEASGAKGCGSAGPDITRAIENAIYESAPEATAVVVEGLLEPEAPGAFVSLDSLRSRPRRRCPSGASPRNHCRPLRCRTRRISVRNRVQWYSLSAYRPLDMDSAHTSEPARGLAVLKRFARPLNATERCELCGATLGGEHQHLVQPARHKLMCACDACAILFSYQGNTTYKRVPRRVVDIDPFVLSDAQWDALGIPIGLAFFFRGSPDGKVTAYYPSPAGATESLLPMEPWADIVAANPRITEMEPDVEALLVNRIAQTRVAGPGTGHGYLVPIDACYGLVGLIRTHWRGFGGGGELWEHVDRFFTALAARAERPSRRTDG